MRWKKSGEIPTVVGHRVYFSGKEDKHEQGVGFLVYCERCHRMSPDFKQTYDSAAESKPFLHYHHSGICTNIQL